MLKVEGLDVTFGRGDDAVRAVVGVSLEVAAGEAVGLVGGSGAGKSTVARAVAGLVAVDAGRICLGGTDLASLARAARRARQPAHLVFQDPYASLPPTLAVAAIVAEPLAVHGEVGADERHTRVQDALRAVRLDPDTYGRRFPHQLSGGERQRVAIARALVTRPSLILADEPTQMLDASLRVGIVDLLDSLRAERGLAVLHITHDLALARRSCAGLLIGPMVDQEVLSRHRAVIAAYLRTGGVVVFGGHLHRDWLPGAGTFVPLAGRGLAGYRVAEVADHPVFAGLTPDELTCRRGVAGFFARGHHPVPDGAEVLIRLAGGEPATYVDRRSSAGTILVHATSDLRGHVGDRLVDWVLAESARVRAKVDAGVAHGGGLAAVYGGSAVHHRALTDPKHGAFLDGGLIYLPDLAETDLTGLDGLIVPERMHRGRLERAAGRITDLLDAGGLVVTFAGGESIPEFMPGVRWEHRPTNFWWWLEPGAQLGLSTPDPEHALFSRLGLRDCTWHYHGVLDPPDGAETLVTLPGGEALLYVDRVSTPGTLVVSTLDPLSHYGGYFMPATGRFLDGFLPWLAEKCHTRADA